MDANSRESVVGHPLAIGLMAAVPLRIEEYRQRGGPHFDDIERARLFAGVLGEKGDILLYRSKKKGESADIFNRLADALAIMAFCPGGVKCFGEHWEANPITRTTASSEPPATPSELPG